MNGPLVIVDVETTGMSSVYHRVIEIAALRVEGGKIVQRYQSLVNPERYISPYIEQITGITNDDVASAPRFSEIAGDVLHILRNGLFVAHNARFDLAFLRSEFARIGKRFQPRVLCTVKLSRKLFPESHRHDLSSVIERHGIHCRGRHRAMGDAEAVFHFLESIRSTKGDDQLQSAVAELTRTRNLPPHLDPASIEELPESYGVYLMYGRGGELLYVGKSKNVRERVLDHFSSDREIDMCQRVSRVDVRSTAGDLGASLLELHLIKDLHPMFNQVARSRKPLVVARRVITRQGYVRVTLAEREKIDPGEATTILATFKNRPQALRYLATVAKRHRLCHKLLGLEETSSYCFAYHLKRCQGACAGEEPPELHNARLETAFSRRRVSGWPFRGGVMIKEEGIGGGHGEQFIVDQWCLLSSVRYSTHGHDRFVDGSGTFDYDSYKVLSKYLRDRRKRKTITVVPRHELAAFLHDPTVDGP